eukprot:CAMPEP_0183735906 /NCGR_PEP_ID=MMETSP0737-20130205/47922_1 /TAXON_ID=385413 /ORGANISM="Thalassiosira miniscula, Strain CCMP1093" /LENGTH=62 /DNA_ID=CAMNT_0025969777 /DNA_START=73 /DNA_END=258 /DNA_ORIENTATION=+
MKSQVAFASASFAAATLGLGSATDAEPTTKNDVSPSQDFATTVKAEAKDHAGSYGTILRTSQ